eukprot:1158360-Pelagomonas_calceolata.AAC.6
MSASFEGGHEPRSEGCRGANAGMHHSCIFASFEGRHEPRSEGCRGANVGTHDLQTVQACTTAASLQMLRAGTSHAVRSAREPARAITAYNKLFRDALHKRVCKGCCQAPSAAG